MGGGGAFSTPRDYMAFLQALLNGGTLHGARVLRPETVALMMQNQIGELNVTKMTLGAASLFPQLRPVPGQPHKWGLSFDINTQPGPNGRSRRQHLLGGAAQQLLLARSGETRHRRDFHPGASLFRPGVLALYGAFERGLYAGLA